MTCYNFMGDTPPCMHWHVASFFEKRVKGTNLSKNLTSNKKNNKKQTNKQNIKTNNKKTPKKPTTTTHTRVTVKDVLNGEQLAMRGLLRYLVVNVLYMMEVSNLNYYLQHPTTTKENQKNLE